MMRRVAARLCHENRPLLQIFRYGAQHPVLQKRLHMHHQNPSFRCEALRKASRGYGELKNIILNGTYGAFPVVHPCTPARNVLQASLWS